MSKPLPTVAELRKLLSYNPDTGELRWKHRASGAQSWNARYSGAQALNTVHSDGYRMGQIHKVKVYAHRVAWALHHGSWPSEQIDHINGDRADNRIANLRQASASENAKNLRPAQPRSSGVPCVFWSEGSQKWRVRKRTKKLRQEIGSFHCIGQALRALSQLQAS